MIQKLNANAQPYYTLIDPNSSLLSAPKGYDLNVDKFVEFLDNGLTEFKSRTFNEIVKSNNSNSSDSKSFLN